MLFKVEVHNKLLLILLLLLVVFVTSACSSNSTSVEESDLTSYYASSEDELSEETPIFIDEENKQVKVFATVNGKYLTEPTRHGLNWVEGAYGDEAVFKGYANPLAFYESLMKLGGTPAVEKGGDPSQEFEVTEEGKFIKGDELQVTITWPEAEKEYDINEVMVDSTGKPLVYHFGGNYDAAKEKMTGCFMCFDSCPVGITSNSSHPVGTFADGNAEFSGNADVLPDDGEAVILTYAFVQ